MPAAASYREKLRFEKRTIGTDDGYGNREQAWAEQFTEMARVQFMKGSESVIASRLAGVQPVIITIRSSAASRLVEPNWRAVNVRSGVIYNLRAGANFDDHNRDIQFIADSGVPT